MASVSDPDLRVLIDEITKDAYGIDGFDAFVAYFDREICFPLRGRAPEGDVEVVSIVFDGDERRGLMACTRDGREIELAGIVVPPDAEVSELLAAYRRWIGLDPS